MRWSLLLCALVVSCGPAGVEPVSTIRAPWGAIDYCERHPEDRLCRP